MAYCRIEKIRPGVKNLSAVVRYLIDPFAISPFTVCLREYIVFQNRDGEISAERLLAQWCARDKYNRLELAGPKHTNFSLMEIKPTAEKRWI